MRITDKKIWYRIKPLIPGFLFEHLLSFNYFIKRILFFGDKVFAPFVKNIIGNSVQEIVPDVVQVLGTEHYGCFILKTLNFLLID